MTAAAHVQVIAEHLYQQGRFGVGDTFVAEAGVADGAALKQPYLAMHSVLKEVPLRQLVKRALASKSRPPQALHALLGRQDHDAVWQQSTASELAFDMLLVHEPHAACRGCMHGIGTPVLPGERARHAASMCRHAAAQIVAHNLQPALEWAREHRAALVASSGEQAVAACEFRLHRLQFLHLLQVQGAGAVRPHATPTPGALMLAIHSRGAASNHPP